MEKTQNEKTARNFTCNVRAAQFINKQIVLIVIKRNSLFINMRHFLSFRTGKSELCTRFKAIAWGRTG
jgi:hypothetical protein